MENKRKIPYGVINWAEIVRECLSVDNTAHIRYKKALARRPDWKHPIAVTVVEVRGSAGYNWFDLPQGIATIANRPA